MSSLSPDDRATLGRFATGVTVITTTAEGARDHGMTVGAFASPSLLYYRSGYASLAR